MTRFGIVPLALAFTFTGCGHHKPKVIERERLVAHDPIIQRTDPKLVELLVEPTASMILANATDELGIHVRITAKSLPEARRPPLDVALVLDTSGSMEGQAIDSLRTSAHAFVDKLRDGDRAAIVTFDSTSRVLYPSTVIGINERLAAHTAIDGIVARGTTDLEAGLREAATQLSHQRGATDITRIVLLSDGVPNTTTQLPTLLAQIKASGYSVTTLGLGLDYDTTLMTRIASDTGGGFYYIESPDQIAAVYDDELTKMQTVVARNLQLELAPGPGVMFEPLAGYTLSAGRLHATIGDIPAGGVRDFVFPIKVIARTAGSTAELVDATLSFTDIIGQSGQQLRTGYASARASNDTAAITASVKIDLEVARVRASTASAILEAMNLARSGQLGPAKQRIAQAVQAVRAAQAKLKTKSLDAVLGELAAVAKELAQMVVQIVPPNNVPDLQHKLPHPLTSPSPAGEMALRRSEEKASATVRGEN